MLIPTMKTHTTIMWMIKFAIAKILRHIKLDNNKNKRMKKNTVDKNALKILKVNPTWKRNLTKRTSSANLSMLNKPPNREAHVDEPHQENHEEQRTKHQDHWHQNNLHPQARETSSTSSHYNKTQNPLKSTTRKQTLS
jgi:hypothetical protein